jgi:phosphoglycolate phosphatase-like HAD superfamily hydrolase
MRIWLRNTPVAIRSRWWIVSAPLYREQAIGLAPLLPGAVEAVAAARELGGVVVITGKVHRNAVLHLEHVGLLVDETVGGRTGPEKVESLRELRASVYVADQTEDMAAARAAGVSAVGVTTGPDTGEALVAAGADVVIASLAELPAILQRLSSTWDAPAP